MPEPRQRKLIMFDFDGVIADSLADQCRAYERTFRAHGLGHLATCKQFVDFTEDNWFAALAQAGVPPAVVEDVEDAIGATPVPELFPGMAEVIERLAAAHPVFVITSSRTAMVERILSEHGVRGVMEVLGGDRERSKIRKIRAVRRRVGESLPAWYVGDTIGDMVEARAAGAVTVGATWGWHGTERLLRASPDHLAHSPSDLLDLF